MMKHNYLKQAGQNKRVTAENIMENCHFPEKCLPAHCEIQGFCKIITKSGSQSEPDLTKLHENMQKTLTEQCMKRKTLLPFFQI